MGATYTTPEETMTFYHILTDFVDIPQGSPGRVILDGFGITTVPIFVQVPN